MIAFIQVRPTAVPETFRVDLENHTDTLRISELYSRNTGMDDDRYPDYKSEHEVIAQMLAGVTTVKGIISQAKVASRTYDEELDDYVIPAGWIASFKLYNQTFNYLGIEHQETPGKTPEEDQELPEPPSEIAVETDEDSDPIADSVPGPGELLIVPPDIGADAMPWGLWVRATGADALEPAKHFNKPVFFCRDDGTVGPIWNVDLAYKFKNLGDNPNLLNSCPEAFEELRADLGVSYYFENKNVTSE